MYFFSKENRHNTIEMCSIPYFKIRDPGTVKVGGLKELSICLKYSEKKYLVTLSFNHGHYHDDFDSGYSNISINYEYGRRYDFCKRSNIHSGLGYESFYLDQSLNKLLYFIKIIAKEYIFLPNIVKDFLSNIIDSHYSYLPYFTIGEKERHLNYCLQYIYLDELIEKILSGLEQPVELSTLISFLNAIDLNVNEEILQLLNNANYSQQRVCEQAIKIIDTFSKKNGFIELCKNIIKTIFNSKNIINEADARNITELLIMFKKEDVSFYLNNEFSVLEQQLYYKILLEVESSPQHFSIYANLISNLINLECSVLIDSINDFAAQNELQKSFYLAGLYGQKNPQAILDIGLPIEIVSFLNKLDIAEIENMENSDFLLTKDKMNIPTCFKKVIENNAINKRQNPPVQKNQREQPKKIGFFAKEEEIDESPNYLTCPITQEIMREPVIFTLDGRTYEKEKIVEWLKSKGTSPVTRAEVKLIPGQIIEDLLIVNFAIKDAIEEYIQTHRPN